MVMKLTAVHSKMARAALDLGVRELASLAKVSPDTVSRLERGEELKERTIEAIQRALEAAGLEFTNGAQPGVRLVKADTHAGVTKRIKELQAAHPAVDDAEPRSPQKAMRQMKHAHATNEITKLKNRRAALKKRK